MVVKLIKTSKDQYHIESKEFDGAHLACYPHDITKQKLSLKNCQAIERGYDLDEIKRKLFNGFDGQPDSFTIAAVEKTAEIMFEILGDKKFSEDDMRMAFFHVQNEPTFDEFIQSLQQTEWDVIVETKKVIDETKIVVSVKGVKGSGNKINTYKSVPKLDVDGCLILKRI